MLTKKAASPTTVMPRYVTDGHGRDTFITFVGDRPPPFSQKSCQLHPSKVAPSKHPVLPKFIPSGNGRDIFCQVNEDKVYPSNTKGMPSKNSVPKNKDLSFARTTRPPTYHPSGSGRDLHYTANEAALFTLPSKSFRIASPTKIPRPRSSPPPRFVAAGSGRDTFQNTNAFRPSSPVREKDQGFVYGSNFLSQSARYTPKGTGPPVSPKAQQLSTLRLTQSSSSRCRPLSSSFS
jgi:hypothetical protein